MTERAAGRGGAPRRRLLAVVAMGVLAAGALSACQQQPGTAALVGDTRFTDAQIDKSVSGTTPPAGFTVSALRSREVTDKVTIELARRYAADNDIAAPTVDPAALKSEADALKAPTTNGFVIDDVTAGAWITQIATKATAVTPTDAQLLEIYTRAKLLGLKVDTFAEDKAPIAAIPDLGSALAAKVALDSAVAKYHVQISPRYLPTTTVSGPNFGLEIVIPTQASFDAVSVPLSGAVASPAVVSVPSPSATGDTPPADGGNAP